MNVKFKKLLPGAVIPKKATPGSAAYDLYTAEDVIIKPGRQIIPLGFAMEMEPGIEALVDPRSGFSSKGMEGYEVRNEKAGSLIEDLCLYSRRYCLSTLETERKEKTFICDDADRFDCDVIEGKIDSDFRGGVGVIVHNRDRRTFLIKAGTRIAQMTFHKVETVEWIEVDELSPSERDGGFGSTGVS